jgi:predicted amidohydrolase YtcJ
VGGRAPAPGPGPFSNPWHHPGGFIDGGVRLSLGSAGPPEPAVAIALAVGAGGRASGRPLTREEAVRAMTWDSAYAEKAERDKGWLGPGTLADLAVLSDDIFAVSDHRVAAITSVLTVVGGTIVYDPGVLPK